MVDDRSPLYRQIAEQIRADVLRGAPAAGDQVMSTTQDAAFHRINPATAARAFQDLVEEGVLEKRRGIGMFVTPDAADRLRASGRARFADEVLGPVLVAARARDLGLDLDDVVDALRRHPLAGEVRS